MIVNLVEFDKSNVDLIEMLKKYSKQNCRDELDIGYVSTCLKNMYRLILILSQCLELIKTLAWTKNKF